tara:strand:+ start:159 stop:518 length:360 start_codon:yes stop_codon:yes gene_type:complete
MKTAKEIFDKRYLYYRDMLNKPAIPLEARQLIFDAMEEYAQSKVNDVVLEELVNHTSIRISDMNLSRKIKNILFTVDIETLGDLMEKTEEWLLLNVRRFGRKSLDELKTELKKLDLALN